MWLLREKEQGYRPLVWLLSLLPRSAHAQEDLVATATASDASKTTSTIHTTTLTSALTCEARTINYITHTLPQQCLTSAPPTASPVASSTIVISETIATATDSIEDHELDSDGNDLSTGSFMSFEEFKAMMLKKSGQENLENRPRRPPSEPSPGEDFDSLGEEGEISLDFDVYSDKISEITSAGKPAQKERGVEESVEKVSYDDVLSTVYRSKDAGKTCKERFSYSSFDAGATVLKASRGAKNTKAILVENKDSYMLLECAMENKYFIVELSDDIVVDTVVLANFEFFSSMIRDFRVSVSDRWPVKTDKWKVLGEFQARNSRDIQPFLVENPQIWARYLRVEILSHYGKEYYCPVSLLRVHGTRMLDSWKEADLSEVEAELEGEEDIVKPAVEIPEETSPPIPAVSEDVTKDFEPQEEAPTPEDPPVLQVVEESDLEPFWDLWHYLDSYQPNSTCALDESPNRPLATSFQDEDKNSAAAPARPQPTVTAEQTAHAVSSSDGLSSQDASTTESAEAVPSTSSTQPTSPTSAIADSTDTATKSATTSVATSSSSSSTSQNTVPASSSSLSSSSTFTTPISNKSSSLPPPASSSKSTASTSLKPPSAKPSGSKSSSSSTQQRGSKAGSSTSSSTSASPTVQDSFFKQLTKRLQTLESNTTLSLQYIESQSKFLQEALNKLERRQVSKVDMFLDTLNKTVLSELREVRTQYDQIWQSTIIALESQREQSEREIVALSSRLGVLADEVVFQKRMAIVQSVLLLGCLVLVIFSRGLATAGMELYYPSQLLGAGGRFGSPSPTYPMTPRWSATKGQQRSPSPLIRDSVEGREDRSPGKDADSPPRPHSSRGPSPEVNIRPATLQRHLSLPETRTTRHRLLSPSPDPNGLEYYQPPTPASLADATYDSEPANTLSPPRPDYFAKPSESPCPPQDRHSLAITTAAATTTTEVDPSAGRDGADRPDGATGHAAGRPALSHAASSNRKPLPALPEDSD